MINYTKYKLLSTYNSCKTRYIFSPRGIIYDRYNNILVTNKTKFRLILLAKIKDIKDIFNTINNILIFH